LGDPAFLNSDDAVLFHAVTYCSSAVLDSLVRLAETLLTELRERETLATTKRQGVSARGGVGVVVQECGGG